MLHTKYQGSRHYGFRQDSFPCFSLYKTVKHVTPQGRGNFSPQRDNLNNLGRGPLDDATYQISKALGVMVSDKIFYVFSLYKNK